jgi:hypothetical protein
MLLRESPQDGSTISRDKKPMLDCGADYLVVVWKAGNTAGAKGITYHSPVMGF